MTVVLTLLQRVPCPTGQGTSTYGGHYDLEPATEERHATSAAAERAIHRIIASNSRDRKWTSGDDWILAHGGRITGLWSGRVIDVRVVSLAEEYDGSSPDSDLRFVDRARDELLMAALDEWLAA